MQGSFAFEIDEGWQQNIERLRTHLEAVDARCAKILFENLSILETTDNNARRDFNQKVLEAIEATALAEIDAAGDV